MLRSLRPLLSLPLALTALGLSLGSTTCHWPSVFDVSSYTLVSLAVDPAHPEDLEFALRGAFLAARPGTIIELPAGTFPFRKAVVLESSHVVLRGQGMYETILDFTGQEEGAQGILVRGDHFMAQDFAIINPAGDGIKTEFITGATFERLRVEWTAGPDPGNGDYGVYPAQNTDVLISQCIVKGARDAGIYVGQSENVVVRWSVVENNVLGIEVENSIDSDVYGNIAFHNTGGIAVFNLPNLQVDGFNARVFDNTVFDNNTTNFAAGGILAMVPGGTGLMTIGHDQVEIFNNRIWGNQTGNLAVSGFQIALETINDADYDPFVETVYIHDNEIFDGGDAPDGILGLILANAFDVAGGNRIADIILGGYTDPAKFDTGAPYYDPANVPTTLNVRPGNRVCIQNNGGASFGNLNGSIAPPFSALTVFPDLAPHDCVLPPAGQPALWSPVVIPEPTEPPVVVDPYTPAEVAALCGGGPPGGVNWDAFVVDCPDLADYGLFGDPSDPTAGPNGGGLPFDLRMPLFSDYAQKYRFVFLPPGTQATWSDDDPFDFPVGTIIAKTFAFVHPTTGVERVVETRLLVHRDTGWKGLPFIWDDAQTAAALSIGGGVETIVHPLDASRSFNYFIPATPDCGACHFGTDGDAPIGPKARQLNRDYDYGGGVVENQIDHWAAAGLLAGAPASSTVEVIPGLEGWDQPGADVDATARAYLDANCAHCHNPVGRAGFTGLHLVWGHPVDINFGICKRPVAAGSGALGLLFDLVPGDPDHSILVQRVGSTEVSIKMPEIEKNAVHEEALALLEAWVTGLPGSCSTP